MVLRISTGVLKLFIAAFKRFAENDIDQEIRMFHIIMGDIIATAETSVPLSAKITMFFQFYSRDYEMKLLEWLH